MSAVVLFVQNYSFLPSFVESQVVTGVHQRPLENVFHHLHTHSSLLLEQWEKQPPENSFWMRINRSYCLMSWDKLSTRRQSI